MSACVSTHIYVSDKCMWTRTSIMVSVRPYVHCGFVSGYTKASKGNNTSERFF